MNRGKLAAIKLREEIGIVGPSDISLEDVVIGRGGIVQYRPMGRTDGRIVYGTRLCTIFINSEIQYEGRRRFALAHELGHLEMHKGSKIHDDHVSLNWFNHAENQLRKGRQEYEANEFASEYLMPSDMFRAEAQGRLFNPDLLKHLSNRFETSLTSTAFKYCNINLHPILMFHIFNGTVKYWKRSDDFKGWVKDITKLPPPKDSVAMEYLDAGYKPIYVREELQQEICKSTYLQLRDEEEDCTFYEYCIVSKAHNSILSIVWED